MHLQLEDDEDLPHRTVHVPSMQNADTRQLQSYLRYSNDPLLVPQYSPQPTDEIDLRPSGLSGGDHKAAK